MSWNGLIYKADPCVDDILEVECFYACCKEVGYIDYDGHGYYGDGVNFNRENRIWPSKILQEGIDPRFTHVVWFNR